MGEPNDFGKYRTEEAFLAASHLRTFEQINQAFLLSGRIINPEDVSQIQSLMTPLEVRGRRLSTPAIMPTEVPLTFNEIYLRRGAVRALELAPRRADDVQAEYVQMDHNTYLRLLDEYYLHDTHMSVVREMYPSALAQDIEQLVVWVKDDTTPDAEIAEFIAKIIGLVGLTPDDIILFERSRVSDAPYQWAKTPEKRHIHLWLRPK